MTGWLITNRFLNQNKFSELYDWLIEAAHKAGSELKLLTNADLLIRADRNEVISQAVSPDNSEHPDYIIFWDKDIRLAGSLEASGFRLFNRAEAIRACDDKSLTCSRLAGIVRMPVTFNVPFTYESVGYRDTGFLDDIEAQIPYPYILKECFGSFGEQVYLINSRAQCENTLKQIEGRPCLIQEYIGSGTGRDIRLIVVGGRCIAAMLRSNDTDFRANVALGGHTEPYSPTEEEINMAVTACKVLDLDYAGVDILHDRNGTPVLCEVNSNAHFRGIFNCTGVNVADAVIAHILETV